MSDFKKRFLAPQKQYRLVCSDNKKSKKQLQKIAYALIPISEEKLRKQVKSVLHQEITELNQFCQMSMEQIIKVVLNLQEEVRKLRRENEKLTEKIQHRLLDTLYLRMANQEREIDAPWNYQREQISQMKSQVVKFHAQNSQIEKILFSQKIQIQLEQNEKMEIEKTPQEIKKEDKLIKIQKLCHYCKSKYHLRKNYAEFCKVKEKQ